MSNPNTFNKRVIVEDDRSFFEKHWLSLLVGGAVVGGLAYWFYNSEDPHIDNVKANANLAANEVRRGLNNAAIEARR